MRKYKDALIPIAVLLIWLSAYVIVGAMDRYDEAKITLPDRTVEVSKPPVPEPEPEPIPEPEPPATVVPDINVGHTAPTYTEAELEAMAIVIYQEAGGDACSDETRFMVGNVVLNRVADERFPNTIEEVLLQKQQYGRLYWTGLVWPERASQAVEAHAVERAYRCAKAVLSGVSLLPPDVVWQAEFVQGTEIVVHQDGFYFCR